MNGIASYCNVKGFIGFLKNYCKGYDNKQVSRPQKSTYVVSFTMWNHHFISTSFQIYNQGREVETAMFGVGPVIFSMFKYLLLLPYDT